MRFGIDFAGGTEVAVRFAKRGRRRGGDPRDRRVVRRAGPDRRALRRDVGAEFLIRFNRVGDTNEAECPTPRDARTLRRSRAAAARLAEARRPAPSGSRLELTAVSTGSRPRCAQARRPATILSVDYVGPQVGDDLRRDGLKSIGIATLASSRTSRSASARASARARSSRSCTTC
jgi:preprotein translocase subunit SecF